MEWDDGTTKKREGVKRGREGRGGRGARLKRTDEVIIPSRPTPPKLTRE